MATILYVCAKCGAICRHLWWAELGLTRVDGKCPKCGRWAEFESRIEADLSEKAA
jgi:DNA-directed RNA polymerase subunit RPC12/RpoP